MSRLESSGELRASCGAAAPGVASRREAPTIPPWAWRTAGLLGGMRRLARDYQEVARAATPREFVAAALARLGITPVVADAELESLPAIGPLVVVANHPHGGADGLVLLDVLLRRRGDLMVLATSFLLHIGPLAPMLIPVDNFDSGRRGAANASALRRALDHVRSGGALLLFPAGVVSHLDLREGCVVDPPWVPSTARLLRRMRTPVVPAHVSGRNSAVFQLAGVLHPLFRTLMLPSELQNKRGSTIVARLGDAWDPARIAGEKDDAELAAKLRLDVYALAATAPAGAPAARRVTSVESRNAPRTRLIEPVAPAVDPDAVAGDIAGLPEACRLASCGALDVYAASAALLPSALVEIGRLREITFRAAGEGTGSAVDLDRFDRYYHHLVAWDREACCIAGAYRIGRIDEIRRAQGRRGLYLDTLFELREPLFALLGPALELGRSFVRPEYQRSFTPLLALWRGVGAYVAREPRYARLVGPVSISASHDPVAIELLVRSLGRRHGDALLSRLARARRPYEPSASMAELGAGVASLPRLESLSGYLAARDPLGRGVPVLLRQYLKLGGRILAFHVDEGFGSCVDCLTVVDLRLASDAVLGRYMDPAQLAAFRARTVARGRGSAGVRRAAPSAA